MAEDRKIIHEITPLMGKDVLYIADRHKKDSRILSTTTLCMNLTL